MEDYKLVGRPVRVTWNDRIGHGPHNEQTVFRGEVAHQEGTGLWLFGSFFIEKAETLSVREVPREKDGEERLYFAPWSSIEAIQLIEEGTRDFQVHQRILARRDGLAREAETAPLVAPKKGKLGGPVPFD